MIISHKHRFVFIHNPKVGGTSIRTLLKTAAGDVDDKYHARGVIDGTVFDTAHLPVTHWTDELVEAYRNGYYFFGLVRDPIERFKSALSEILFQTPDFVMRFGYRSVDEFVCAILTRDLARWDSRFVHFSEQFTYFKLPGYQDSLRIDVFSLENLKSSPDAWATLWKRLFPSTDSVPPFENLRPSFFRPLRLSDEAVETALGVYAADYDFLKFRGIFYEWPWPLNVRDESRPPREMISTERLDAIARTGFPLVPRLNTRDHNAFSRWHNVGTCNSAATSWLAGRLGVSHEH